eukprot:g4070.t1
MTFPLLGGGTHAIAGPGYGWMEGINNGVGAPEYVKGTNRGTLEFRIDRIDFSVTTATSAIISTELFVEAQGSADALLEFYIGHYDSVGRQIGLKYFRDRGDQTGITSTSTPWEITLNPGDYLRYIDANLRVLAITRDLNLNGVEDTGDVFYSRVVTSFGLKIDTTADFTSELGGLYTGALPLNIPETSSAGALAVGILMLLGRRVR